MAQSRAQAVPAARYRATGLLVGCLVAASGCGPAETPRTDPAPATAADRAVPVPTPIEYSPAPLVFDPDPVDMGWVVPGGVLHRNVTVTHAGERPLVVSRVLTSCECTTAELPLPMRLAPGQAFTIPVILDMSEQVGGGLPPDVEGPRELVRELAVRTTDEREAGVEIHATVTDALTLDPSRANLRRVVVGTEKTMRIDVGAGRGDRVPPVRGIEVPPDAEGLRVIDRSDGATTWLEVTWGPFDELGERETEVFVHFDGFEAPLQLPVRAEAVPLVEVSHPQIQALAARPTQPVVQVVAVRRVDGEPLRLRGVGTNSGKVKYHVLDDLGDGVPRVRVIVAVPPHPERVEANLILDTDAPRDARQVIPIVVQAIDPKRVDSTGKMVPERRR